MGPRRPKAKWSMWPDLHDDVSRILAEDRLHFTFNDDDDEESMRKYHNTNIMGRFICHNRSCKASGWSSKKIAIRIRLYNNDEYNARVYHQSCNKCKMTSKPHLDFSYADRIVYRLKRWKGFELERPRYNKESKGPHLSRLCEGCKAGHCTVE